MIDVVLRLLWFVIAASIASYSGFVVVGNQFENREAGKDAPVVIRDELSPNLHDLSGVIMVPSPCDELLVRTQALSSTTYVLLFRTWREPSVTCADQEMPRSFRTQVFAPSADVSIIATMDGRVLPIVVLPIVKKH